MTELPEMEIMPEIKRQIKELWEKGKKKEEKDRRPGQYGPRYENLRYCCNCKRYEKKENIIRKKIESGRWRVLCITCHERIEAKRKMWRRD